MSVFSHHKPDLRNAKRNPGAGPRHCDRNDVLAALPEENLQMRQPDCEHDFPKEVREEAYRFIDRALKFMPDKKL
jgi:hypothetical protein